MASSSPPIAPPAAAPRLNNEPCKVIVVPAPAGLLAVSKAATATQPRAPAKPASGSMATVPIGPRISENASPISSAMATQGGTVAQERPVCRQECLGSQPFSRRTRVPRQPGGSHQDGSDHRGAGDDERQPPAGE